MAPSITVGSGQGYFSRVLRKATGQDSQLRSACQVLHSGHCGQSRPARAGTSQRNDPTKGFQAAKGMIQFSFSITQLLGGDHRVAKLEKK